MPPLVQLLHTKYETQKKNNNIKLNWESGLHFSFMLLPIRVCVCVYVFISQWDFFMIRFLSGHFNFHASSFVFFLFVTKKTEENERKSKTVYEMLYNWNSKYWNVHWFPCASIAGQEPIDWKKNPNWSQMLKLISIVNLHKRYNSQRFARLKSNTQMTINSSVP